MRIVSLACLMMMLVPTALLAQAAHGEERARITVSGEAVVYVQPDKILVTLGIETWNKEVQLAKQENNEIQKRAMAAIKECGVATKDIQTDRLSIEPRYRGNNYTKDDFVGYFVRNSLVVTLKNSERLEDLITKVLDAGVTHIHGIDFQTTEFKKHRERARELALLAAKEKAQKMAAVLGQKIGAPLQITESGSPSWYYSGWGGRQGGMSQNAVQNVAGDGAAPTETIALGKIGIRTNVQVVFALKE